MTVPMASWPWRHEVAEEAHSEDAWAILAKATGRFRFVTVRLDEPYDGPMNVYLSVRVVANARRRAKRRGVPLARCLREMVSRLEMCHERMQADDRPTFWEAHWFYNRITGGEFGKSLPFAPYVLKELPATCGVRGLVVYLMPPTTPRRPKRT